MLREGDKIKVHMFTLDGSGNWTGAEIKTRNYDRVFEISRKNGVLGIDWNDFTPLDSFTTENGAVVFEGV